MIEKTQTAVRDKAQDAEFTRLDNKKQFMEDEVKRLTQTRDELQEKIDSQMANYNMYIAQRDSESKKFRQEVLDEKSTLESEKAEFQAVLEQFKKDKAVLAEQKSGFEREREKSVAEKDNIRQFVIAVQRACSLLGL